MAVGTEQSIRILVVEDNAGDVDLLKIAFNEFGKRVDLEVARDGREALSMLGRPERARSYHLIVLDLNLPFLDGFSLLETIKGDPRLRDLPAVVLTSSDRPVERARAKALNADAYYVKPVSFDGYATIIRSLGQYLSLGRS